MSTAPVRPSRAIDCALRERAAKVIPDGMYGAAHDDERVDAVLERIDRAFAEVA